MLFTYFLQVNTRKRARYIFLLLSFFFFIYKLSVTFFFFPCSAFIAFVSFLFIHEDTYFLASLERNPGGIVTFDMYELTSCD